MALSLITFSPNTRIKSAEVNSNFNALNAELFDIDQSNFNPGAQLPDSLFAQIQTPSKVNGAAIASQTLDAVKGQFVWTVGGTLIASSSNPVGFPYRPSAVLTALSVYLEVTTAPTGAALIVDIKKNGATIFTTKPQINAGSLTGGSGAIFNAIPMPLAVDDKLEAFVTQIGSTIPGSNLVIALRCKQKVPQ